VVPDSDEQSAFEQRLRDERAGSYDKEYQAIHGPWFPQVEVRVIRRLLDLGPKDVFLDLGCGTGRLVPFLAPLCREVIAVDRSHASLEVLRARVESAGIGNVRWIRADVTRPISIGQHVTKAMSVQVLQHVPTHEGRLVILGNLRSALQTGGRCLLIDEVYGLVRRLRAKPREVSEKGILFFHTFTGEELMEDLKLAGLRALRVGGLGMVYWTKYRFAPAALVRLDALLSSIPGSGWVAKFQTVLAERD
jgi:SAM-dependent methyltransferase